MSLSPNETPELLTPVSEERMLKLTEIEALRQIADNLRRLNNQAEKQTEKLHAIDIRLTRIEEGRYESKVEELEGKIDKLEAAELRRAGAVSAMEWTSRFGPWLLALIGALVVMALAADGKIVL